MVNTVEEMFARMVVSDLRVRYLTGGVRRAREAGIEAVLRDFADADEIIDGVADMARRRLHEIPVFHAGTLADARVLGIADPGTFFGNGVRSMFDYAESLGLPTQLDEMVLVAGKDRFGSANYRISKAERLRRMLEGQLAGAAEFHVHHPDHDLTVIYSSRMIPTMVDYTRQFVNRGAFEHSGRYELRQTRVFDDLPYRTGIRPVHQARAPMILGSGFAASSDSILFGISGAVSTQYKSFSILDALTMGSVDFVTSGGVITGVRGPDLVAQLLSDGLRAKRRGFRVPDGGASLWTSIGAPPAGTAHWHDLSPVTLAIVDSTHLMNQVIEVVGKAFAENPTLTVIDPMVHLRIPVNRQRVIRDILGSSIARIADESMEGLARRGLVEKYMERRLPLLEAAGNFRLTRPDIVSAVGQQLSMRLLASHQAVEIIAFLETQGIVVAGTVTKEML